ncbi:MAG: hypothetical protein DCC75_11430 [Proteobacteria bacterium]|nr:MAG: hypothetical protein DCC75_11430 [Pseudomonadota bacterium]
MKQNAANPHQIYTDIAYLSDRMLSRHGDIIFALVILALSSSLSFFAYERVLNIERPESILSSQLKAGSRQFSVIQNNKCVGSIESKLLHENTFYLNLTGELRFSHGQERFQANFQSEAYFNPLGQLTESLTKLTNKESRVFVQTHQVNPIKATLSANLGGKRFSHAMELPGPLILSQTNPGWYELQRPPGSPGGELLHTFLKPASEKLGITLKEDAPCGDDQQGKIDLTPYLNEANSLVARFLPFIQMQYRSGSEDD